MLDGARLVGEENPGTERTGGGARLLLVDGDAAGRESLERDLMSAGFEVATASDVRTALKTLSAAEFELILLDAGMTGSSGVDLLSLLRASHSSADVPVLVLAELSEPEGVVQALQQGANDYLTKPIDFPLALTRIQSQLDRRRDKKRYAGRNLVEGFWDWDLQTGVVLYSARWKAMLGLPESETANRASDWLDRVHRQDRERLLDELASCRAPGGSTVLASEHRLRHEDGGYRWMQGRASVLRDGTGAAERIVGSHSDVTHTKCHDPLTGLPNRFAFLEELAEAMAIADEFPEHRFSVLTIDLDRFKSINDSLGYQAGDAMLREIGRRLQGLVRTGRNRQCDLVARLGGDEFGILLDGIPDKTSAHSAAARILSLLQEPFSLADRQVVISASVGAALYTPLMNGDAGQILSDAETAMHRAKELGKSCIVFFEEGLRRQLQHRLHLEHEMRGALERNEFVLHYQPKVDLGLHEVTGFEALIRWQHPQRGLISPGQFIPIAEETGHIVPLGHWTLFEACRRMTLWMDEGPWPPLHDMSVNLSIKQILRPDFVAGVESVLRETGVPPDHVHLEVTETVFIQDVKLVSGILRDLKSLGVGLSLDDFGTGYSSLQYLVTLPIDYLKIDRSFVSRMCQEEQSLEVVKTIIALARRLGMGLIAEGVETMSQAQILRDLGCQYAQGYYFGKPMPEEEALRLLIPQPRLFPVNQAILSP